MKKKPAKKPSLRKAVDQMLEEAVTVDRVTSFSESTFRVLLSAVAPKLFKPKPPITEDLVRRFVASVPPADRTTLAMHMRTVSTEITNHTYPSKTVKRYVELARAQHVDEGRLEIDDTPLLSIAEDGDDGAYVAAWVWVDKPEELS